MQRKGDVFELSRNLSIYKLIYTRFPLTAGSKESLGHLRSVAVCQFVNSLFRSLGSVELGYISEEELEDDKKAELWA
jgi:hypothetical protein